MKGDAGRDDTLLSRLRLFRFWAERECEVVVANERRRILCRAGSNESRRDAEESCERKAERVQGIVDRTTGRRSEYEKPTREHILEEIGARDIITRNYYGARILNTCSTNIFDIDRYRRTFWEWLTFRSVDDKKGILELLRRLHREGLLPGTTWRIYETCKGIRVIVLGEFIEPGSDLFKEFCGKANVDALYSWLCVRQRCYRARLTPKPHRMRIRCMKYRCPIPEGQERVYADWERQYETASEGFAVCRLLETLGDGAADDPIVELHDRHCLNGRAKPLA